MNNKFKKYSKLTEEDLYQELRKSLKKQDTESVLFLITSSKLKDSLNTEKKIADFFSAYALETELKLQATNHENIEKSIFINAFMSGTKKQKSKAQDILEEEINNPGKAPYSRSVAKALNEPVIKQMLEDYKNDDLFIVRNKVLNNIGGVIHAIRESSKQEKSINQSPKNQ